VRIVHSFPNENGLYSANPVIFIQFDQRVHEGDTIQAIEFYKHGNSKPFSKARKATQGEIEADKAICKLAADAPQGQWIACVSNIPFSNDGTIIVKVTTIEASKDFPEANLFKFSIAAGLHVNSKCGKYFVNLCEYLWIQC
jgi:hypothetical protein